MSLPEDFRPDEAMSDVSLSENGRASGGDSDWMDARVEAYVDEVLPPKERAAFEERLRKTPRCQRAVRRARRLERELRALPQPDACPPEVTQAVLDRTVRNQSPRRENANERSAPRRQPRRPDRHATPRARRRAPSTGGPATWQPALALALLLAGAAAVALLGRPVEAPPQTRAASYSHAEVQRAEAQAEWALALVAQVTRETGETVREDVLAARLGTRLTVPVREAIATPALDHLPPPSRSNR